MFYHALSFGPKALFLREGNHAEGVMGGVVFEKAVGVMA